MLIRHSRSSRKSVSRKHRRTHGQFTHQRKALFEQLEDRRLLAVYASGDVPQAIPDQGTVLSTLEVADSVTIGDLNVTLDISHTRDKDLDVFLVGPDGTRVQLMTDVGGNGNHFQGTVLDDEAASSITSGSAPFAGSYQPEGALSSLDGKSAQGTWALEVTDDQKRDTGTLNSWSIEVTPAGPVLPSISISDGTITEGNSLELFVSAGSGGLDAPIGIQIGPDGNLYVASRNNDQILRYDGSTGAFLDVFVSTGSGGLDGPKNMAFGSDDNLYVVSAETNSVLRYQGPEGTSPGAFIDAFVATGSGGIDNPYALAFGTDGHLYLSSSSTGEVLRYQGLAASSPGTFIDDFVPAGSGGLVDPSGLVFGPDDNLYVANKTGDNVLRYQGPAGASPGAFLDAFVEAGGGGLDLPYDLTFGPDQNLYVSSGKNDSVLRYQGPAGASPGTLIDVLATATSGLDNPHGYVFDAVGNMVVTSTLSDEVMRYSHGLTVTLSSPSNQTVTVDYVTADGTALAGGDYASSSGTLTFAPGETTKKILLVVSDDGAVEGDETFTVNLSNPTGDGTIIDSQGVATIIDDDAARQISIDDVTVTEGDDSAHFRGAFVNGLPDGHFNPITFGPDGDIYTSVGAGAGNNTIQQYDGTTGAFLDTFMDNSGGEINGVRDIIFHDTDGLVYVASAYSDEVLRYDAVTGDYVDVFVTANSGGIDHPDGMAFGPDVNDDGFAELYVTGWLSHSVVRYDGASGAPLGTYITSSSGGLSYPFAFDFGADGVYVTSAGTDQILKYDTDTGAFLGVAASEGLDYPRGLTFGPGGLLYVTSGNNDRIIRYATDGTYVDDFVPAGSGGLDDPRSMAFGSDGDLYVTATGNREILRFGTETEAVFTVSLSSPSPLPVTVDFNTETTIGSAVAGSDYTATSGTLTFAPGVTTQTILVSTTDDTVVESTENFFVNLSVATGAVIQDSQGEATIIDDDGVPTGTKFFVVDDDSNQTFEYDSAGNALTAEDWNLDGANASVRGAAASADGSIVWAIDSGKKVYVYDSDGALSGSWSAKGGLKTPTGIASDGTDVWIADTNGDKVLRYSGAASRTSGNQGASSSFSLAANNPSGITTDGTTIWVVDSGTDHVYRYDTAGNLQGDWALTAGNSSPTGLTIDPSGASNGVWVVDNGADAVYEYDRITGAFTGSFALAAGNANPQGIADPPPMLLPAESDVNSVTQLADKYFAAAAWKAFQPTSIEAAKDQAELFETSSSELSTNGHQWRAYREQQRSELDSSELPSRDADATDRAIVDLSDSFLTDDLLVELTAVISS